MSDEDKDLDIRQEEQERKRKQREKTNKWRKENPEKARELARRQAAKRRAEGRVAKVPKDKKAGYQRKYRRSLKERTESLIEDLKVEIYDLQGTVESLKSQVVEWESKYALLRAAYLEVVGNVPKHNT